MPIIILFLVMSIGTNFISMYYCYNKKYKTAVQLAYLALFISYLVGMFLFMEVK